MSLSELPAAVLDVVVECAGFDQGWRLEVASAGLRATSMDCAAVRLGKCRWTAGDRAGTEFKPCWRHVAVALRRCPYYVLKSCNGQPHIVFREPRSPFIGPAGVLGVPRHEADKFKIAARPGDDEGEVWRIPPVADLSTTQGALKGKLVAHGGFIDLFVVMLRTRADWILHLRSHASHLPFRRCRVGPDDSPRIERALSARDGNGVGYTVGCWELAPATLADDERFEWRVV